MHYLLSAKSEHLAGQVGGPFTGGVDIMEAFNNLAGAFRSIHEGQTGVSTDDCKEIIT
jgi:hypothetical protein